MLYKSNTLFDISALEKRKIADQAEFERVSSDFLKDFRAAAEEAMDIMSAERDRRDPLSIGQNWPSVEMNGLIMSIMGRKFPQYLKETGRGKGYKFVIEGKYEVYIKKLNYKTKRPFYNHTLSSKSICEQVALPNEDPLPVIFVGYTTDRSFDEITGYYAVCTASEGKLSWITDIDTMNGSQLAGRIDAISPAPVAPRVTVRASTFKKAN